MGTIANTTLGIGDSPVDAASYTTGPILYSEFVSADCLTFRFAPAKRLALRNVWTETNEGE